MTAHRDLQHGLVLALISAVAGFLIVRVQLSQASVELLDALVAQLGSFTAVLAVSTAQVAILGFVATFAGRKIARRVALSARWLPTRHSWLPIILVALASALLIGLSDRLVFAPYLPDALLEWSFSPLYFAASVLYGGIVEELLLRLLVMSLLVLLIAAVARGRGAVGVSAPRQPAWIYVVALVLAALIFAAGHLPATAQSLGLSLPIVIRAFVLNGLAGIGFGWLYWRYDLGSAIAAHMGTHVFMQLVVLPFVTVLAI